MKFLFTITGLLLFMPAVSTGQTAWTLDECISYAVANSPAVGTARAQSEINSRNLKESVAGLFPSFSAGTSAQFNFGRGLDYETNTYTNVNSFYNSYEVGGSITLFDGLSSIYSVKMNKAGKLMGLQDLQIAKDEVAFKTAEQFFLVQGYREMVELCREQLEEKRRTLTQTERMAEVGIKAFPDVAEMKAQYASAQYNLTRYENLLRISLIQLKEQMNFPLDEEVTLSPFPADENVAYAGVSPMEVYAYASGHNPVALSARLSEDHSLYSYKTARGGMYPTVYMRGGFSTGFSRNIGSPYENFRDQLENKRGHYIAAGISIPIFNGLSSSSNTKRAALNLQIARNRTEQTLRTLYSEIEQAVADVNGQADEFRQLKLRTEAAELAHRLNLRKYEEGLISAVELHTSSNRLLESRAEATSSILTYHLKSLLLDYYKGIPMYVEFR